MLRISEFIFYIYYTDKTNGEDFYILGENKYGER